MPNSLQFIKRKSSEKKAADEEKREEEAKDALQEISRERKRAKRLQDMVDGEKDDPTFKKRKDMYRRLPELDV